MAALEIMPLSKWQLFILWADGVRAAGLFADMVLPKFGMGGSFDACAPYPYNFKQ
jgi:hypothetical protein